MHRSGAVLAAVSIPLISGCMTMGRIGHTDGPGGMGDGGYAENVQGLSSLQRVESRNAGLIIELSFPTPTSGARVAIDARLRTDGLHSEPTDGDLSLRIQAPSGTVVQIPMQRVPASSRGTHRAQYTFPSAGVYLVSAEGRMGTGADARTVSVTSSVEVGGEASGSRHAWLTPLALVGGLAIVAMMAFMMGGSAF